MMNLKKWLSEFIKRLLVGGLNIKEALQLQKLNLMAKIKALINGAVIDGVKPDLTALFKRAKQYLQTTAHTWANTVSNGVLSAWGKNRVSGWRHISVLDSRTSLVCTARHGKLWDKKHQPIGHDWVFHVPPLHPNCRSMLVPASLDEPFEGITGDDWVNSRSLKELQEQFGVGIGQMLHDGTISLHDAVRQGGLVPMTLKELRDKLDVKAAIMAAEAKAVAAQAIAKAKAVEPLITADMKVIAQSANAQMAGLEYALKSKSSLARKIETEMLNAGIHADEAVADMKDVLRYTMLLDADNFTQSYQKVVGELLARGYHMPIIKNTWRNGMMYKGINTNLVKDGQVFELQFHTRESFDLKNGKLHELYEEWRLPSTPETRKIILQKEMLALSDNLKTPKDIDSIQSRKNKL